MDEDRLMEIEIKLSRSEDLLETLNQVVYEQQKKIERLEASYAALLRRVPEAGDVDGLRRIEDERPPHY